MIAYIKGAIEFKSPTMIVVEAAGIGYTVHISLNTYAQIEKLESVKILTHLLIKEDSHSLYGFANDAERRLFVLLLSVSGVGATTAQLLLSAMTPHDIRSAILMEQETAFSKVKGIGPKTAKRIILDLKDKIMKENPDLPVTVLPKDNTLREEALSALIALGFSKPDVQKALNKALSTDSEATKVEDLIKSALKQLT